jgi:hypothetical protein
MRVLELLDAEDNKPKAQAESSVELVDSFALPKYRYNSQSKTFTSPVSVTALTLHGTANDKVSQDMPRPHDYLSTCDSNHS